jgi:hypothetical protein
MSNDRAAIENVLGFDLPESAQILLVDREAGMDDMLRAKIEMPRSSFDALAHRLPVPLHQMNSGPGRLSADKGLWNPRSTQHIKSGQAARPGGRFVNIGVAQSDQRVTLFVVDHGT